MPLDQAKKKGRIDGDDSLLDLPQHILELITKKLTVSDFIRFGAVQARWRSIAKEMLPYPECQIPWLIVRWGYRRGCEFLNLLDRRIYKIPYYAWKGRVVGYSDGWLLSGCIYNPFTGDVISLPRFQGTMLSAVLLKAPSNSSSKEGTSPKAMDFVVVARFFAADGKDGSLAFGRPNDKKWTFSRIQHPYAIDAVVFEGCIYMLSVRGSLWVYDPEMHSGWRLDTHLDFCDDYSNGYLVELCGDLLIVMRTPEFYCDERGRTLCQTIGFQVFKLDIHGGPRWVKVESLGHHALFVGKFCSRSLCAMDFLYGIRQNCIYFNVERSINIVGFSYLDMGIFSLEDGSIESYVPSNFQFKGYRCPTFWVMSKLQFDKLGA